MGFYSSSHSQNRITMKFTKGKHAGKEFRAVAKSDPSYLAWMMEEFGSEIEEKIMDETGELFRVYFRKYIEEHGESAAKKYPRAMSHIQEPGVMVQILRKLNRIEALLVEVLDNHGSGK